MVLRFAKLCTNNKIGKKNEVIWIEMGELEFYKWSRSGFAAQIDVTSFWVDWLKPRLWCSVRTKWLTIKWMQDLCFPNFCDLTLKMISRINQFESQPNRIYSMMSQYSIHQTTNLHEISFHGQLLDDPETKMTKIRKSIFVETVG